MECVCPALLPLQGFVPRVNKAMWMNKKLLGLLDGIQEQSIQYMQPLERREEQLLCILTFKSMGSVLLFKSTGLQRCSPANITRIFPHTVLYVFYAR